MMNTAGCDQRSAGIGDIAYVKDLLTEKIITTKLRCSKFGVANHRLARFGWVRSLNIIRELFSFFLRKKKMKSNLWFFNISMYQ